MHAHPPFTLFTITYKKVAVCAPANIEQIHSPILSIPLYVLCGLEFSKDDKCGQKRHTFFLKLLVVEWASYRDWDLQKFKKFNKWSGQDRQHG